MWIDNSVVLFDYIRLNQIRLNWIQFIRVLFLEATISPDAWYEKENVYHEK